MCIPKAINYILNTTKQSNDPGIPQVGPQEHLTWYHEDPCKYFSSIINLLLYIILLIMVLTCLAIQHPIKISSILGIFKEIA